jgi:hypothetical protein
MAEAVGTPKPITDYTKLEFGPVETDKQISPVRCMYGPGEVETKGGGGVWEVVKRPYLPPLTVWKGPTEAYSHKIPLMLDAYGHGAGESAEQLKGQYAAIEAMAGMQLGVPLAQWRKPPTLFLNAGGALPHDHVQDPSLEWVILEPPEWGKVIRPAAGESAGWIVRQVLTVTFMLFEGQKSMSGAASKSGKHNPSRHEPKGTTFEKIAARQWPKKHRGKKLLQLNQAQKVKLPRGMNPSTPFPRAIKVIFPSAEQERNWAKEEQGH